MKRVLRQILGTLAILLPVLALIYAIWQPVLPGVYIVRRMAAAIDPQALKPERTTVVCFHLSGKGGGVYSLVAGPEKVETLKGMTDQADLILFMEAADFNHLMFTLARGKGDEYTFQSLIISKVLRFAGDLTVFRDLFDKTESKGGTP